VEDFSRGHVRLDAEDGLDPGRGGLPGELHGPVEVAVVGHGHRVHAQGLDPL
jgi:hypothetical protein